MRIRRLNDTMRDLSRKFIYFYLTIWLHPPGLRYRTILRSCTSLSLIISESGRLEFEEFVTLAAKFIVEEDAEALEKELREAFRLYDKEGEL